MARRAGIGQAWLSELEIYYAKSEEDRAFAERKPRLYFDVLLAIVAAMDLDLLDLLDYTPTERFRMAQAQARPE